MWHIHKIEYYSVLRRNESQIHATTWMNFKNMLNEMSDTKEQILQDFIYIKYLEQSNLQGKQNNGYQEVGRGRNKELLFNKWRVSIWDGGKIVMVIHNVDTLNDTEMYT